ncbi:MAG TPA: M23 family metallopeptidase [Virgibacillus sp.]|nr:M23 family metallopeptidase [Virgibacillus sp.]
MMSKKIKKVRKSIEQRKRMRGLPSQEVSGKQLIEALPQDEEKHGYFPDFSDVPLKSNHKSKLVSGFMLKGMLSVMLFFGVALLWQTNTALLQQPKGWASNALTEDFPFARVNQWYQETFGAPLAFSPEHTEMASGEPIALPVSGSVTESFQANGTGVMISPADQAAVAALNDGVVVFSGNDRETNKTVIVQHADGSKTTYGYLSSIDVHLYQFITSGQQLGQFTPTEENETVYFSIEKDKEYVDPVQVIKVDDNS